MGRDKTTVLTLNNPKVNTPYYLFMIDTGAKTQGYQYQYLEIHVEYQPE